MSDLHLQRIDAADPTATVILVHGALDRHNSFRRVARRLADDGISSVLYDRRGYNKSLDVGPPRDFERHVADLLTIVDEVSPDKPATVVGHSIGALTTLTAASVAPERFASIGAFEPPTGWKDWWPDDLCLLDGETPEQSVRRFHDVIIGRAAWEGTTESVRAMYLAEGPALQIDLAAGRRAAPFEPFDITAKVALGKGDASMPEHIRAVDELADEIPDASVITIPNAGHGAHRSHPTAFANFVGSSLNK